MRCFKWGLGALHNTWLIAHAMIHWTWQSGKFTTCSSSLGRQAGPIVLHMDSGSSSLGQGYILGQGVLLAACKFNAGVNPAMGLASHWGRGRKYSYSSCQMLRKSGWTLAVWTGSTELTSPSSPTLLVLRIVTFTFNFLSQLPPPIPPQIVVSQGLCVESSVIHGFLT